MSHIGGAEKGQKSVTYYFDCLKTSAFNLKMFTEKHFIYIKIELEFLKRQEDFGSLFYFYLLVEINCCFSTSFMSTATKSERGMFIGEKFPLKLTQIKDYISLPHKNICLFSFESDFA